MKHSHLLILAAVLAACAQAPEAPRADPTLLIEQATQSFPGLGIATLPAHFESEAQQGSHVSSFAARDAELRDTLMTLFKDSDINLIIDSEVQGRASFDIKASTLEEVFAALLESYDLAYRWDGDFLRIEAAASRVFDVDFPGNKNKASGGILAGGAGAAVGGSSSNGNANRGFWTLLEKDLRSIGEGSRRIVVNRRLGTVGVEASPKVLARIAAYLQAARRRSTQQVSIEARILEVSLKKEFKLGVDWSLLPGFFNTAKTGSLPGSAILSQNARSGAETFRFGLIKPNKFSVFLDALETQGQVRVLSSPRISTLHNVPAVIRVVEQVPVIEREIVDTVGASRTQFSVRFEDAGVSILVTPQIGDDGFITAEISPSIVEVSGFVQTPDKLITEPILNTRMVSTILRVPDGQPIVLGGLRSERKSEKINRVPLLGDIPIFGKLFQSTTQERVDTELVIMLVPRILNSAWEREDVQRSLDRIHRLREPFESSTISMGRDRIGLEEAALEGPALGPASPEQDAMRKARRLAAASSVPQKLTRRGLARLAFCRAIKDLDSGELTMARASLDEARKLDEHFADAWLLRASLALGRGRLEEARRAFKKVVQIRPMDPYARNGLGLVALRRGSFLYAEESFRALMDSKPSAELRNNLGVALLAQGRIAEARSEFEAVQREQPALTEASLNLAVCLDRAGETQAAAAAYRAYVRGGGRLDDPRLRGIRPRIDAILVRSPQTAAEQPAAAHF